MRRRGNCAGRRGQVRQTVPELDLTTSLFSSISNEIWPSITPRVGCEGVGKMMSDTIELNSSRTGILMDSPKIPPERFRSDLFMSVDRMCRPDLVFLRFWVVGARVEVSDTHTHTHMGEWGVAGGRLPQQRERPPRVGWGDSPPPPKALELVAQDVGLPGLRSRRARNAEPQGVVTTWVVAVGRVAPAAPQTAQAPVALVLPSTELFAKGAPLGMTDEQLKAVMAPCGALVAMPGGGHGLSRYPNYLNTNTSKHFVSTL